MRRWLIVALILGLPVAAGAQPLQVTSVTFHSGATATAVGNTLDTSQMSTVVVHVIPGPQDTYRLIFQASLDNTNWDMVSCYPQGSSTAATSITTTVSTVGVGVADRAIYRCNVAGYLRFRVNLSTLTNKGGSGLTVRGTGFQNPFALGGVIY